MTRRTRIIALVTGLLLFAGQSASLVHATDHPFHAPDEICASFISLEHHDSSMAATTPVVGFTRFSDEIITGHVVTVYTARPGSSRARAPPLVS